MLHTAADILTERHARGDAWDLGGVFVVVPGRQAGRRLRRILQQRAAEGGRRLTPPDILTPADLPERLYAPPRVATPTEAFFAWMGAIRRLERRPSAAARAEDGRRRRADGRSPGRRNTPASARAELMAAGLTFQDAARQCESLPGFCDDARWPALAQWEQALQNALAQAGLTDRDDAAGPRSVRKLALLRLSPSS